MKTRSRAALYKFRLYVAGDGPNSARAIANLAAFCHSYLPSRHVIEVVDVFRQPKRALEASIFMTPTLVKMNPLPVKKIVGTLSDERTVSDALGLEASVAAA